VIKLITAFFVMLPKFIDALSTYTKKVEKANERRAQEKKDKIKTKEAFSNIDIAFDTGDEELLNEISDS